MLSLFGRRRPAPVRRTRLGLEALGHRDAPADLLGSDPTPPTYTPPTDPAMYMPPPGTYMADQPPQITSFTAQEISAGRIVFSGTVADENPAGLVVMLGGSASSVDGKTVQVQADGTFSITIQMATDGTESGTVTAVAQDFSTAQSSNIATTDVNPTVT